MNHTDSLLVIDELSAEVGGLLLFFRGFLGGFWCVFFVVLRRLISGVGVVVRGGATHKNRRKKINTNNKKQQILNENLK